MLKKKTMSTMELAASLSTNRFMPKYLEQMSTAMKAFNRPNVFTELEQISAAMKAFNRPNVFTELEQMSTAMKAFNRPNVFTELEQMSTAMKTFNKYVIPSSIKVTSLIKAQKQAISLTDTIAKQLENGFIDDEVVNDIDSTTEQLVQSNNISEKPKFRKRMVAKAFKYRRHIYGDLSSKTKAVLYPLKEKYTSEEIYCAIMSLLSWWANSDLAKSYNVSPLINVLCFLQIVYPFIKKK